MKRTFLVLSVITLFLSAAVISSCSSKRNPALGGENIAESTHTPSYTFTVTAALTAVFTSTPANTNTRTCTATVPVSTPTATPTSTKTWVLIWSDEFNASTIDPANWSFETGNNSGWGNGELENYTSRPVNAYIDSGNLVIQAQQESYGGFNYTSARMKSQGLVYRQYGRIEASIKAPYGQGIWPAFWMLGQDIGTVGWPACGEMDIMEMIGGGSGRDNVNYGTAHWDNGGHQYSGGSASTVWPEKLADNYHVYGIEWDSAQIRWYFDGVQYYSVNIDPATMSEFQAPMFIVLNIAVGGTWPGSPDGTTAFPQRMYVDWVRWWNFQ
jgi:beta-glucanase (GH16 family)